MISAPSPEIAKRAAKMLLDTKSVLFNAREPFVFTSGRISPVYTDCRRLISFPSERSSLMDMGAAILKENVGSENMDFLAGGETAGIPYAAFLSDRLNKPMLYVRKKPKGFGRMAQIEGCMDLANPKVILVEDLQTDGGSKKIFIDALRQAGATVEHGFVVFHYGIFQQSIDNMNALSMTLHYLTDWWAVLQTAKDLNYFDNETLASVESFLRNPDVWATENAHLIPKKEQA
ncbi:MAG: orotate phosphoribosyltransferase [Pseudomonadota bacterium]